MNIFNITEVVRYVRKNINCPHCDKRYNLQNINVLAATKNECLIELKCKYCKKTMLTDIVSTPKGEQTQQEVPLINQLPTDKITDNDVLDVRNFLTDFDGNFKSLFKSQKQL